MENKRYISYLPRQNTKHLSVWGALDWTNIMFNMVDVFELADPRFLFVCLLHNLLPLL
jgi:hypothetical protein